MSSEDADLHAFHWLVDMVESVEVGLVVLDLDHRVQAWNGFMENHSGLTASRVHNRNLFDLFPELPKAWLVRKINTVATLNTRTFTSWEQRPWVFRFRNTRPVTGIEEYMFQNLTISPLNGTDGSVEKVCLTVYDVTDMASSKRALEQANEQLLRLSVTDRATGLFNRVAWENLLDAEYERYFRYGHHAAVALLDIDHFKTINDTHGHLRGDEVILKTAQTIREKLRQADRPGRFGGDEFGIILPETDAKGALCICERIRDSLAQFSLDAPSGAIQITVSIGVAVLTESAQNCQQWLKQADSALYQAKEAGRNQVVVYS
ncbi:sensor domain-containing diguanylate cyclase [Marinobacter sp. SS21]|uniref:sensor domain-containing diguanylate cyclase n=1 Tax=Marinobacter sp. SS21 TaxID=2979460 RepID=UPI00232C25D9|nr:sensor domain-containing diguanylate cyclase [Marinobacter sp. SS21]MDC0663828.1 diguanylate cyclase [Marinobacter sp. SS21]